MSLVKIPQTSPWYGLAGSEGVSSSGSYPTWKPSPLSAPAVNRTDPTQRGVVTYARGFSPAAAIKGSMSTDIPPFGPAEAWKAIVETRRRPSAPTTVCLSDNRRMTPSSCPIPSWSWGMTAPPASRGGGVGKGRPRYFGYPVSNLRKVIRQDKLFSRRPSRVVPTPSSHPERTLNVQFDIAVYCMPLNLKITGPPRDDLRNYCVCRTNGFKHAERKIRCFEAYRRRTIAVPTRFKRHQLV